MGSPTRTRQCGTVLADVKAKPFGWPAASLDPGCGRRPIRPLSGGRSTNSKSPRFQGIASPA